MSVKENFSIFGPAGENAAVIFNTSKKQIQSQDAAFRRAKAIHKILSAAETLEKPNFTQLQLALQEWDADDTDYLQLRHILELKFHLPTLDFVYD
jgi:hypothetical protein